MNKLIILTLIAVSIAFTSCHSNDKNHNHQNDTGAAKDSSGRADSIKTVTPGDSSSDTTTLGADTDSAVHPVH